MPVCIRLRVQVQQAVSVAKGQARLRSIATASGGGRTIFSVELPVERAPCVQEDAAPSAPSQQAAATNNEELAGASQGAAAQVPAAGPTWNDMGPEPEAGSSERAQQTASPLVCAALDDDEICRVLHEALFEEFLHADTGRSAVDMGGQWCNAKGAVKSSPSILWVSVSCFP